MYGACDVGSQGYRMWLSYNDAITGVKMDPKHIIAIGRNGCRHWVVAAYNCGL